WASLCTRRFIFLLSPSPYIGGLCSGGVKHGWEASFCKGDCSYMPWMGVLSVAPIIYGGGGCKRRLVCGNFGSGQRVIVRSACSFLWGEEEEGWCGVPAGYIYILVYPLSWYLTAREVANAASQNENQQRCACVGVVIAWTSFAPYDLLLVLPV
ncbi:unnamed protein product, partial [Ectocarpus sp. 12 AP-2014]